MSQRKKLLIQLIKEFYPYAKKQLGFTESCKVGFTNDRENAKNPLGKTAYYDPEAKKVTVYMTERHIKDIMRSVSHELVHHAQNCRGEFANAVTEEGYAQNDPHLRKMEEEAYLKGNMIFRDWTDSKAAKKITEALSLKECKRCKQLLETNSDNFHKDSRGKFDFHSQCKICENKNKRENRTTYNKREKVMKPKRSPIIKKRDWKEKLFESRNRRLMEWLFYKQGVALNEEEDIEEGLEDLEESAEDITEEEDIEEGVENVSEEDIDEADLPSLTKTNQDRLEKNKAEKAKKEAGRARKAKLTPDQIQKIKEAVSQYLKESNGKKVNKSAFTKALTEQLKKKDRS